MFAKGTFRFVLQLAAIYSCFLSWGYLQEKITSTRYVVGRETLNATEGAKGWSDWFFATENIVTTTSKPVLGKWTHSCALNLCMAISGALTATLISAVRGERNVKSIQRFWYAALTCAAASPIGYASLQYINYPMMVLAKTMKPVPVLLVGAIGYGNRYPWYQYVTVLCLSGGLALYTFASDKGDKGHSKTEANNQASEIMATAAFTTLSVAIPGVVTLTLEILKAVWGIILVCVNLTLDGCTNNEQDKIFADENISGIQMMKYTNIWQVVFISIYLLGGWVCFKSSSELSEALLILLSCPEIQRDIGLFCICASLGQILVFQIMEEHGSLVWITISITRKLFTILVSVIAFHHPLNFHQCIGIAFVFAGITLELIYKSKKVKTA